MVAQRLAVAPSELDLDRIHDEISTAIPAGQPTKGRRGTGSFGDGPRDLTADDHALLARVGDHAPQFDRDRAVAQYGTLGGGNHFVELCEDSEGSAWFVLHSGSRGVGNSIAKTHIAEAKGLMRSYFIELDDPDLAYLVEGTPEFDRYIEAMLWAQDYAAWSRSAMMRAACRAASAQAGTDVRDGNEINCHHNYTVRERHHGQTMWITRKGAINARAGAKGIIPGSMATGSFIVTGKGSPASYESASHGAGRTMSRNRARKTLTEESLSDRMEGIVWNDTPDTLLDEHPAAYKDLDRVMANQADLVEIEARLTTVLNYKGQ